MTIPFLTFKNVIMNYVTEEIICKMSTNSTKFAAAFATTLYTERFLHDHVHSKLVLSTKLIDEQDNIDVDALYEYCSRALKVSGPFTIGPFKVPMLDFGSYVVDQSDLDTIYKLLKP